MRGRFMEKGYGKKALASLTEIKKRQFICGLLAFCADMSLPTSVDDSIALPVRHNNLYDGQEASKRAPRMSICQRR